jgi:peptide/nickel transport system permease protein
VIAMGRYVAERLFTALLSVVGIAIVVFFVSRVLPGDAATLRAGQYATPEQIAQLRAQFGLNQPILVQFGHYLNGLVHFDLGVSTRTGRPVAAELSGRLPATLELSIAALLVALIVGVPLGALAAAKRGTAWDALVRLGTIIASSAAVFWVGLMAIYFLSNLLHWFPSPVDRLPRGIDPPTPITGMFTVDAVLEGKFPLAVTAFQQLMLPALTLGLITAAPVVKIVRSAMSTALRSDYVRTARAFGLPRRTVLVQDAFRNSLIPVVTSIGIVAGYLIGGNIIIEQLFSWPGLGQYAYESLQQHDLNAVQGFVIFVGVGYVALNFVLDLTYASIDPRVELRTAS